MYGPDLRQEFVVGGNIPSNLGVDSLVVGFYRGKDLIYAARVRAGLVPATRREVFERLNHFRTAKCPFANLPEPVAGWWGQGLTAEKMKECVWVATGGGRGDSVFGMDRSGSSKNTKFVGLRDDKELSKVIKET
jgi:ATP-dependent DNA ligase